MHRNRNFVQKLGPQSRNVVESDTPRTDAFVERLPPLEMSRPIVEIAEQMRALMIAWATFARDLEHELNQSVPKEWGDEPFRNGPDTKL